MEREGTARHEASIQANRNAGADCAKVAERDKRWNELGLEEKVDRLRSAVRINNERANFASRTGVEALDVGKRHEHGGNGQVVMPVDASNRNFPLLISGKGESENDYVERLLA